MIFNFFTYRGIQKQSFYLLIVLSSSKTWEEKPPFPFSLLGSWLGLCNKRQVNKRKHFIYYKFYATQRASWGTEDLKKCLTLSIFMPGLVTNGKLRGNAIVNLGQSARPFHSHPSWIPFVFGDEAVPCLCVQERPLSPKGLMTCFGGEGQRVLPAPAISQFPSA